MCEGLDLYLYARILCVQGLNRELLSMIKAELVGGRVREGMRRGCGLLMGGKEAQLH